MAGLKRAGVSTAKARRKDGAARNRAHGLATRGRTKKGLNTIDEAVAALPETDRKGGRDQTYVIGEHLRRDTGSLVVVLDLQAPDAPEDGYAPYVEDDGTVKSYALECVTHHSGPRYLTNASQAKKEAKSSHQWCAGCKADLKVNPKVHNKARAQTRSRAR